MKKSIFRILVTLFAAAIFAVALIACSDNSDKTSFTALNVTKGGLVVNEITFTEGEHIDYSQYLLLVSTSDDSSFTAPLLESSFDKNSLSELYALSGGITKNMTIRYQDGGQIVQGMIDVKILKPQIEVKTYTLHFLLERNYASYRFNPVSGLTRITSLPESHPELPIYNRIEWYRDLSDASTKIELPYEMKSDMTVYGRVVDTRSYTVRFWKDKVGDEYENQIGTDVSSKKFKDTVTVPNENIDKVGYDFVTWMVGDKELSLTGAVGNKYFYIRDIAGEYVSFPEVQIINVYAVYSVKNYSVSFGYFDGEGNKQSFDSSTPYGGSYQLRHGGALSIGGEFAYDKTSLNSLKITAPPLALGEGYKGTWYINEVVFGENQTRTVQNNIYIYAKYEKLKCGVVFRYSDNKEISKQVDYGYILNEKDDIPENTVETGYSFSWKGFDFDLSSPIVTDVVINEVKTPVAYRYEFYLNDSKTQLYSGECLFNQTFALWDDAQIKTELKERYKSYYSYGWYRSESADAETEPPIIGDQTQSAGTMKFFLKTKDLRRYTVNFYSQKGDNGAISASPTMSVTVKYAMRANFDTVTHPVVGWKASALYRKDSDEYLTKDISLIPSDYFSDSDATDYTFDIVVRYERETYTLELYEPTFTGSGNTLIDTVTGVLYETPIASVSALTDYVTADKTVDVNGNTETFRFYGWADESGDLVDLPNLIMKSNTKLYAKWIALSEGSFGIKYELRVAEDGSKYAAVVGYDGDMSEFIIGSKYVSNGEVYAVTSVEEISIKGKNISVRKVTVPSSVTMIAAGAFSDFYSVSEFEAAAVSQYFKTENGVLYSKDGSKLIAYPYKKEGEFHVPAEVTSIESKAFLGYSVKSIVFPYDSRLTDLGENSFGRAVELESIALPNGLISIGKEAFAGCVALKTVLYQGSTLKKIGVDAFKGTPFFEVEKDGALMLGSVLLRVSGAIADDYVLDDAVTAIADEAFINAAMKTFTVGINSKLTYVGGGAFINCPNLISFNIEKTDAMVEFDKEHFVFNQTFVGFAIYVPAEKLNAYEAEYFGTEYSGDFAAKQ